MDLINFASILMTGYLDIEAHMLETDLRLGYNPLQQSQQYMGTDNPAFLYIQETNELALEAQRLDEIQQVTKGEVLKEDRTAENQELADAFKEIGEALEAPGEALKKREEQREGIEEDIATKAFETRLATEIRPGEDPTERISEAGRQLAEKIRESGDLAIAQLDERSDRTPADVRHQAEGEAKEIESLAAEMEKTNVAFRERIKTEPAGKQEELMAARVDAQKNILAEKAEAAVAGLARTEPAREAPSRDVKSAPTPEVRRQWE
ncbi:hypothetical protein ACQI5H_23775 [Mycobacterium heidelbergense]|uniref:hypothetical protein n=1 Tax=Mycobacterium heidelbergense TaxID=53376 RepID=UPI003CE67868